MFFAIQCEGGQLALTPGSEDIESLGWKALLGMQLPLARVDLYSARSG